MNPQLKGYRGETAKRRRRMKGLRGGGRHLRVQEGVGQGLPGVIALTNPSRGGGDPCARTWWALRE